MSWDHNPRLLAVRPKSAGSLSQELIEDSLPAGSGLAGDMERNEENVASCQPHCFEGDSLSPANRGACQPQ